MSTILVIEDEADLARLLDYNLQQAGLRAVLANTGAAGLAQAAREKPDLVILDIMLPDTSGLEVCRALRSRTLTKDVPILMLTAKGEEIDRVLGFELGADDYVVKPFSMRELVLRVRALLGRSVRATPAAETGPLKLGCIEVDRTAHRVVIDGREVTLTALEFRLLTTLMERAGRVLSRDQLLEDVWDITADVETRTVDTHVKRLREKLGAARDYLETLRGVGYRMRDPAGSA